MPVPTGIPVSRPVSLSARGVKMGIGLLTVAVVSFLFSLFIVVSTRSPAQQIQYTIQRFMADEGLAGGVVAFGPPGQAPTVLSFGAADPTTGRAMVPADRFKIASLSKPMTAEAVMALVARHRLQLDTPLTDIYLPTGPARDPRAKEITLRDLLRHSGGWDRDDVGDPFFSPPADWAGTLPQEIQQRAEDDLGCLSLAREIWKRPLDFDPGTQYAYSNIGYCWLGAVITSAMGMSSYTDAMKALLPELGGMSMIEGTETVVHTINTPEAHSWLVNEPTMIGPAGGWISDAATYWKFAARPVHREILDRPAYTRTGKDDFYGLGWRVWPTSDGQVLMTHYGAMPGAFSIVIKKPEKFVLVGLFNQRPSNDNAAFYRLFRQLTRGAS